MTTKVTAPTQAWEVAATGKDTVLITTTSPDLVKVNCAKSTDAAPGASAPFHELTRGIPFTMSGVSGITVYVQSGTGQPIDVAVSAF